jgi:hypothetical protein
MRCNGFGGGGGGGFHDQSGLDSNQNFNFAIQAAPSGRIFFLNCGKIIPIFITFDLI